MTLTSVDLDPQLLVRAKALTGEKTNRAVLDLALRRLIAAKREGAMAEGMLDGIEDGLETDIGEVGGLHG